MRLAEVFGLSEGPPGNSGQSPMTRDPDVPADFRGDASPAQKPSPTKQKQQSKMADRPGISLSGDSVTGEALMRALQAVRTRDDDLLDWIDDCVSALRVATKDPILNAKFPRFEATPGLDDFDDDDGGSDEDLY